jgi:hypothetical protein
MYRAAIDLGQNAVKLVLKAIIVKGEVEGGDNQTLQSTRVKRTKQGMTLTTSHKKQM